MDLNNGTIESHSFYECGDDPVEVEADAAQTQRSNLALRFVQLEEEHVRDRALEVQCLNALVINVIDSSLPLDSEHIRLLPQYQRMAQYRWNELHKIADHTKLTQAIARQLKESYDSYKKRYS